MLVRGLLFVALCASGASLAGEESDAKAAYDRKDYATCARAYRQLASKAVGETKPRHQYNAACCEALAGEPTKSLEVLEALLAVEPDRAAAATADSDFTTVATSPRFIAALKKADARLSLERKSQNGALADELVKMVELDQEARNTAIEKRAVPPSKEWDTIHALDQQHTTRLKEIVARHGWPGRQLVGKRAAKGAWLLVQHATHDQPFMEQSLALMKAAGNDVSRIDVAYLEDRVRLMKGQKQLYGTQFEGMGVTLKAKPIEDAEHVDDRRRAIGLGSLDDALKDVLRAYAPPAPSDAGR